MSDINTDNRPQTNTLIFNRGHVDCLEQLMKTTWDGKLISKQHRQELIDLGLAQRMGNGFNSITKAGIQKLEELGRLSKFTK